MTLVKTLLGSVRIPDSVFLIRVIMALHVLVMKDTQESFVRVKSIIAPRCLASIMAHVCRFLEISFVLVLLVYVFIRFHSVSSCLKIKNFYVFLRTYWNLL